MSAPFTRPPASEMLLRVYDRPLHPELFESLSRRRIQRDGSTLQVTITTTGHVIEWSRGSDYLVEVIATTDLKLPETGRRLTHKFRGEQRGRCVIGERIRYEVSLQAEVLAPELFLHLHEELATDGAKRGLLVHFRPHHRLGLTPIGYVTAEALPTGLSLSAFHTFPDEFTILKTQTLIEPVSE